MIPVYFLWLVVVGLGFAILLRMDEKSKPPRDLLNIKAQGFVFGTHGRKFFVKPEDTDGHILICGGPGSGKSSSIAIPSLLGWGSRIFAIDIKGELSVATQDKPGERKLFNPMCHDSYGFDPFYLLRKSDNPTQDAHEIAAALIPEPANLKDPFWVHSAQTLLAGFILHYYLEGYSFANTIKEILDKPVDLHVKYVYETSQNEAARLHLTQFATLESKTLAGIFAELGNAIRLFATDILQSILNRFGYTTTEIAVMNRIVDEQGKQNGRDNKVVDAKESGGFLLGCFTLFASLSLVFAALYLVAHIMKSFGTAGNIIGICMLLGVLGFLVVLCRVFRGKKGRPP